MALRKHVGGFAGDKKLCRCRVCGKEFQGQRELLGNGSWSVYRCVRHKCNGVYPKNRRAGDPVEDEPTRTITVYPEPFLLEVERDTTEDEIQSILDERDCGSAGWKEGKHISD